MQVHNLQSTNKKRYIKRIGRGGKRGTYSGRGQKGQGARAGHKKRPVLEREFISRLPKLRGVKNKRKTNSAFVINVGVIAKFARGGVLERSTLLKEGIIRDFNFPVKVLGVGDISGAFVVRGIPVSKSAKEKIEKAGGKVE